MNENEITKYNISILGEKAVGKTSLVSVFLGQGFNEDQISTVGIDAVANVAIFDGTKYLFKIYDTAGQDRYDTIASSTIKLSDGFILVYSVDNIESLKKISKWLVSIENKVNRDEKIIILVGNKIDTNKREITEEEGQKFAKENNMKYFETSAKTNSGVKDAFNYIYKEIYELNKKSSEGTNGNGNNNKLEQKNNFLLKKEDKNQAKVKKKKKFC